MNEAFIGVGSNLGDRAVYISEAIDRLEAGNCEVLAVSRLYETSPVGYADQGDFLNGALLVQTDRSPVSLLALCKEIEQDMGREKTIENGPRNIDLDVLLFNDEIVEQPVLQVPHPRLHERLFVLAPLMDIAADREVPGFGTVRQLFESYSGDERVALSDISLRG